MKGVKINNLNATNCVYVNTKGLKSGQSCQTIWETFSSCMYYIYKWMFDISVFSLFESTKKEIKTTASDSIRLPSLIYFFNDCLLFSQWNHCCVTCYVNVMQLIWKIHAVCSGSSIKPHFYLVNRWICLHTIVLCRKRTKLVTWKSFKLMYYEVFYCELPINK